MHLRPHALHLALPLAAAALFAACGGGGSNDSPPPPPVTGVTLAGVVAKGAALGGALVTATCAAGSGTATSAANGSYSISIPTGNLPCVLEATSSDSLTKLHSVAPATSTGTATANVTPLTELVLAQLTGANPATYAVVPSSLASLATTSAISAAQTAVASTLTAGGVSTASAGDFISGALVAANGGTAGNAYDVVLDQLNTRLVATGTTLATLTTTVAAAAAGTSSTPTTTADSVTLPADLLLRPKAANCASLASGAYRVIKFVRSVSSTAVPWPVTTLATVNLDATTLTFSDPGNSGNWGTSFTWTANGNCRYSAPDGSDIVVSPAGVVVARGAIGSGDTSVDATARGTTRMMIGLPVQSIAAADLAGTWNVAGWGAGTNPAIYELSSYIATIASSGAVTQGKCGGSSINTPESACSVSTTLLPTISTNSAGGFDFTSTDPTDRYVDRGFAYRAGNGELMLVVVSAYGGLQFGTKVRTLALPAVGTITANWNVDVRVSGVALDPLYFRTHTVASINSAAGTLVRNTAKDGSTVTEPQTLEFNQARNGYHHRLAAIATASDGSVVTVREHWALPLRGFGLTPYYLPPTSGSGATANAIFGLSVGKQP